MREERNAKTLCPVHFITPSHPCTHSRADSGSSWEVDGKAGRKGNVDGELGGNIKVIIGRLIRWLVAEEDGWHHNQ